MLFSQPTNASTARYDGLHLWNSSLQIKLNDSNSSNQINSH